MSNVANQQHLKDIAEKKKCLLKDLAAAADLLLHGGVTLPTIKSQTTRQRAIFAPSKIRAFFTACFWYQPYHCTNATRFIWVPLASISRSIFSLICPMCWNSSGVLDAISASDGSMARKAMMAKLCREPSRFAT